MCADGERSPLSGYRAFVTTGHATKWSGATSTSGGVACAHAGSASGQRVRKGQPEGLAIGLGTSPSNSTRSGRFAAGSGTGTADKSAREYGCNGSS